MKLIKKRTSLSCEHKTKSTFINKKKKDKHVARKSVSAKAKLANKIKSNFYLFIYCYLVIC